MNNLTNYDQVRARYAAHVPNAKEIIREPLYDAATYAAAGQTQLQFFSTPLGQGTSPVVGSGAKTFSDTNMNIAGSLPAGKNFLIEDIELLFLPSGLVNVGAQAPATEVAVFADDVYTFLKQGSLQLFVSSKPYLDQAPLMKFPPAQRMYLDSALSDATTAAASLLTTAQYASGCGALFKLSPSPILLTQNTNFNVTLNWPSAVALPSTATAVVFCTLGGVLYRRVQ